VIRAAILIGVCAVVIGACGSSATSGELSTTAKQAVEDREDSAAIQRQVNQQVDERARIALTESETRSGTASGHFVSSETVCTKQSTTAYKCLTSFTNPPATPNVVTNVTCDRDGANCITESK
jgi:tetrahydromethanopterin S-methyltransferase subunit E